MTRKVCVNMIYKYMEDSEIRRFKIGHNDLNKPEAPLSGYYHWYCPRCRRVLETKEDENTGEKHCIHCEQVITFKLPEKDVN